MVGVSPSSGGGGSGGRYCDLQTYAAEAKVIIGGTIIRTPNIMSVSISKVRGQLVNTAQVQFFCEECPSTGISGSEIKIYLMGALAFTGVIKRIDISPSFRCGEKIIRLQAEDYLYKIVNRNITRRQKNPALGPIAFISSIYKRVSVGFDSLRNAQDLAHTGSDADVFTHTTNFADINQFVKAGETNIAGALHPVTKASDSVSNRGTGGGGIILHDHSSLDLGGPHAGGPAKAVFGVK